MVFVNIYATRPTLQQILYRLLMSHLFESAFPTMHLLYPFYVPSQHILPTIILLAPSGALVVIMG